MNGTTAELIVTIQLLIEYPQCMSGNRETSYTATKNEAAGKALGRRKKALSKGTRLPINHYIFSCKLYA